MKKGWKKFIAIGLSVSIISLNIPTSSFAEDVEMSPVPEPTEEYSLSCDAPEAIEKQKEWQEYLDGFSPILDLSGPVAPYYVPLGAPQLYRLEFLPRQLRKEKALKEYFDAIRYRIRELMGSSKHIDEKWLDSQLNYFAADPFVATAFFLREDGSVDEYNYNKYFVTYCLYRGSRSIEDSISWWAHAGLIPVAGILALDKRTALPAFLLTAGYLYYGIDYLGRKKLAYLHEMDREELPPNLKQELRYSIVVIDYDMAQKKKLATYAMEGQIAVATVGFLVTTGGPAAISAATWSYQTVRRLLGAAAAAPK